MAEVRIKDIDEHEIDTVLAEDIDFEGQLSFKKPLMIKGKFKGEIKATSALYVGEKAYVEAKIEANLVSSKGKIKGDMVGHSRVELFSTAQVEGDVTAPDFVVESGCKFNGSCNMSGSAPQKKDGSHHAQPQPSAAQHGGPQAGSHPPGGQQQAGAPQAAAPHQPGSGQQPGGAPQAGGQQQGRPATPPSTGGQQK